MTDQNGPTVRVWSVILGQLPWFLTVISLGAWYAARFDGRLGNLEKAVNRIEVRQERDQAEKLEQMRQEVERLRKTVSP